MNIRGLIATLVLLFGCWAVGMAAQAASSCLVKASPSFSAAAPDFRNDCGHPITIVKVIVKNAPNSGRVQHCFRVEMLEGETRQLIREDKACSVLVPKNAAGNPCDCPAGTAIDLANAPYATGNRTMSQQELAEERQVVEKSCTSSSFTSSFVNCSCLADKVETQRVEATQKDWTYFAEKNYQHCPNDKRTISDYIFKSCETMNSVLRKDHTEFYRCSSEQAAAAYIAQPNFNSKYIEMLRTNALLSCGMSDQSKSPH